MKQQYRFLSCLIGCFLTLFFAEAQVSAKDSLANARGQEIIISDYYRNMKENAPFFNGAEYTGHGQGNIGHAFFETDSPLTGWLEYDGVLYKGIELRYDVVDDAVITRDYTKNYYIRLNSKKIRAFSLGNNEFIQPSSYNPETSPGEGFYQRMYNGSTQVLVKRKKQLNYKTTVEKTIYQFQPFDSYFIQKGNEYIPITGKKAIVQVYADRKTEIRKFISETKLDFRKQPENMLVKVAAFYDQLKK